MAGDTQDTLHLHAMLVPPYPSVEVQWPERAGATNLHVAPIFMALGIFSCLRAGTCLIFVLGGVIVQEDRLVESFCT